ncbi:Phage-related protein [Lysinibacillus sphaericus]|nr:Phage-related protein [Lysinibacillus sphaericus]
MAGDGRIVIDVVLDDGSVAKGVANIGGKINGLGDSGEKASLSIGKIVKALGLVGLAVKAIDLVKNSLGKAFGRIDTMEQFARVMTTLTGSSKKADQVLATVNETVKGTAYGLDVGAKAVQNFVTSNMDVDKATMTFKSWSDAVAFYGDGTNDTLAGVSDALAKATAKGKIQMDTMNRLAEAGIPAMQIYADATGQSVESVAKQMEKGKIDAGEFMDVMNDAFINGTTGFKSIDGAAKEAGASWTGSFDNMKAAVARGTIAIIQSIDNMLTSNGLPDMREMIAIFGKKFEEALKMAADAVPVVMDALKKLKTGIDNLLTSKGLPTMDEMVKKVGQQFREVISNIVASLPDVIAKFKEFYEGLKPWLPLLISIATGIVTYNAAVVGIAKAQLAWNAVMKVTTALAKAQRAAHLAMIVSGGGLKGVILALKAAMRALNLTILLNPWALAAAAAIAAVTLIIIYWKPISKFFIKLWAAIKESGLAIWDVLKEKWAFAVEGLKSLWASVQDFFVGLWTSISDGAKGLWNGVVTDWNSVIGAIKNAWNSMIQFFKNLWMNISTKAIGIWDSVTAKVKAVVTVIKTVFAPLIEFYGSLWTEIAGFTQRHLQRIVEFITSAWTNIQAITSSAWELIKNLVLGPVLLLLDLLRGDFAGFAIDLAAIWENIKTAAGTIWNGLKDIIAGSVNLAIQTGIDLWTTYKSIVSNLWTAILDTIVNIVQKIQDGIFNGFLAIESKVIGVMDSVKSKIDSAWNAIAATFMSILQKILGDTDGKFKEVYKAVESAMTAVKTIIDTIWNLIKNTFINVMGILLALVKGDFKVMKDMIGEQMTLAKNSIVTIWNAVKAYFSSVLAAIVSLVKTKFADMKSGVTSKMNETKTSISQAWTNIKSSVATLVASIIIAVKNKFTEMVTAVKTKMTETKQKIETGWNEAKSFLQNIDLAQIGRDIINGLIKGIKDKINAVKDAVKNVADAITGKIRSILDIHSPSRVAHAIGEFFGIGLANGINATKKQNEAAVKGVSSVVVKATNDYMKEVNSLNRKQAATEKSILDQRNKSLAAITAAARSKKKKLTQQQLQQIQKIRDTADKKILDSRSKHSKNVANVEAGLAKERLNAAKLYVQDKKSQDKLSLEQEVAVWKKTMTYFKAGTKERVEAQKQYQAALTALDKDRLDKIKAKVQDEKTQGKLSLVQEAAVWEQAITLFKKGSSERLEAQKQYQAAVETLNKEIESLNKEHLSRIDKINADLAASEKKLNDEYEAEFDRRYKTYMNFAGLFDEFTSKFEGDGTDLIANLQDQVLALDQWNTTINQLSGRVRSEDLMEELRNLGPKALGELKALNSLSDSELDVYVQLYHSKMSKATEQANHEMIDMKNNTAKRIEELRAGANKELDKVQADWAAAIKTLTSTTDTQLKTLKQVGKDAGKGLLDGLSSMEPALIAKARSIAESIKAALTSALDIHSPSRWMRDMIGKNMMVGWALGIDREKLATLKKAREAAEWMKPDIPRVNGFVNKLRGVTAPIGNVMPIRAGSNSGSTVQNSENRSYNPTFQNYFTRDESSPSEVARKEKQQSQRYAMEMGFS